MTGLDEMGLSDNEKLLLAEFVFGDFTGKELKQRKFSNPSIYLKRLEKLGLIKKADWDVFRGKIYELNKPKLIEEGIIKKRKKQCSK